MVRGCQKKIIYLKNTNSEVFDEAYFVVNDKVLDKDMTECDMVKEANRILDECICIEEKSNILLRSLDFIRKIIIPFLIGILFGVIIALIIK